MSGYKHCSYWLVFNNYQLSQARSPGASDRDLPVGELWAYDCSLPWSKTVFRLKIFWHIPLPRVRPSKARPEGSGWPLFCMYKGLSPLWCLWKTWWITWTMHMFHLKQTFNITNFNKYNLCQSFLFYDNKSANFDYWNLSNYILLYFHCEQQYYPWFSKSGTGDNPPVLCQTWGRLYPRSAPDRTRIGYRLAGQASLISARRAFFQSASSRAGSE